MNSGDDVTQVFVADVVYTFHNGKAERLPRAVVMRGDRIERFADPELRHERREWSDLTVNDFRGHVLVPGFFDAHNHQPTTARDVGQVRTSLAQSVGDLLLALGEEAARRPAGEWITTEHALTVSQLGRRGLPSAAELDTVTPNHPTAVRFGAHTMVLNSLALKETNMAPPGTDPPDGVVDRDPATGDALGPIREYGAIRLVLDRLRKRTPDSDVSAMRLTQLEYARAGVTSVRVPGLRPGDLSVYQSLVRSDGKLGTRVFGGPRVDPTHPHADKLAMIRSWETTTGFGSKWLRLDAVKIFVDGGFETSLHGQTHLFLGGNELDDLVTCAVDRGWSVACHAVSPEAVDLTLDAYEKVASTMAGGLRLAIEHGFFATPKQLERAARIGVWLSTQPGVGYMDSELIRDRLPAEAVSRAFPLATALGKGVLCALGSDWNATPGSLQRPFSPLQTLRTAVTRVGADGLALAEDEAVAVEKTFYLHTRAPAELVGVDDLGGLWPGARGDLVALDADPLQGLAEAEVSAVVVGGSLLPG